ncbi:MAG: aryl-sulfate sulfotransferase [Chitinophagales bacterium]|nr:aryl-sulfate sulfotransferase [Chitinophagales bacterium]
MITILSSAGDSIYADHNIDLGFEFKINDNGCLTYFDKTDSSFAMLDSGYNLIKKMHMGNGYKANKHEFKIFPNGYRLMQCYDAQQMDMTSYGGKPDAQVTGLVIQEIDSNNNVIFEWRSWDHFLVTDAAPDISLTEQNVDYVHCNAMELDFDGNLLLSSRNMDEITKINLNNGDIMWRMGGKHNMYTFINDNDAPKPFSHQHHFTRLPNSHYTMFDNGNYQNPTRSSAKEFVLDQVNKTATLVWSYSHPTVNGYEVFGSSLGSVQSLPNGNRLINWGQISPNSPFAKIPNFTEVDSSGNIVWEFIFADSSYVSYRAFKLPWDRCNLISDSSLIANSVSEFSSDLQWNNNAKISDLVLEYKECSSSFWIEVPLDTNFYHLPGLHPNTCYDWRVQSICDIYADSFYTTSHHFVTLNAVAAFEPAFTQSHFTLYPNPAVGETALKFASAMNCNAEITIYDLPGAIAFHKILFVQTGTNKTEVNLQSLKPGVYIVELKLSSGKYYQQLVIQ